MKREQTVTIDDTTVSVGVEDSKLGKELSLDIRINQRRPLHIEVPIAVSANGDLSFDPAQDVRIDDRVLGCNRGPDCPPVELPDNADQPDLGVVDDSDTPQRKGSD